MCTTNDITIFYFSILQASGSPTKRYVTQQRCSIMTPTTYSYHPSVDKSAPGIIASTSAVLPADVEYGNHPHREYHNRQRRQQHLEYEDVSQLPCRIQAAPILQLPIKRSSFTLDAYIPEISLSHFNARTLKELIYSTEADKMNIIVSLFNNINKDIIEETKDIDERTCRDILTMFVEKLGQLSKTLKSYKIEREYMVISKLSLLIFRIKKALTNAVLPRPIKIQAYSTKVVTEFAKIYAHCQYEMLGEDCSDKVYSIWKDRMQEIYMEFFAPEDDTITCSDHGSIDGNNRNDTEDAVNFLYQVIIRSTADKIQEESRFLCDCIKLEKKPYNDNVFKSLAFYNIYVSLQDVILLHR